MSSRILLFQVGGVILAAAVAFMGLPGLALAIPDSVATFYMEQGRRTPVTVYLDQVGLLIPGGLPRARMQTLASRFGLQPFFSSNGGIQTWKLPQAVSRDSILRLAGRIQNDAPNVVAEAGLVVSRPVRFSPMLVTEEFIAHFHPWIRRSSIDSLNVAHAVEIVRERPNRPNRFLLRARPRTVSDGLDLGNVYADPRFSRLAHANFVHGVVSAYTPGDEHFDDQWHHENDGTGGKLADADLDTPKAWDLGTGSSSVVIAVIDGGFDESHPDLQDNLWDNPDETAAGASSNHDDGGNGFKDDFHGWDFYDCMWSTCSEPECGQLSWCAPTLPDHVHGTAVAGLAAAPMDNGCAAGTCEGIVGVCPQCKIMAIGRTYTSEDLAQCFEYAMDNGADVINCSWYLTTGAFEDNLKDAIHQAACVPPYEGSECRTPSGVGIPIFFATGNDGRDACGTLATDIVQDEAVIAVGGTTDTDTRTENANYGACMDLMAPTHGGSAHVVTVDHQGSEGYNTKWAAPALGVLEPCPTSDYTDLDYTKCFCGTSASTPMVSGIAGLLLSANPGLTREQVQRLLQDTADKIENNSASYDRDTGFSSPSSPENGRGYGRANAYEAVRIAASGPGGKRGVDIMLRDNELDWGNTEQPSNTSFADDPGTAAADRGFIAHWSSEDVKVVASPCPAAAPAFDSIVDSDISAEKDNCIYVRVRNRGFVEAATGDRDGDGTNDQVEVKTYWTHVGTAMPDLPPDFWSGFQTNTFTETDWHFIGKQQIGSVPYSGSTAARESRIAGSSVTDDAQVVMIPFLGPKLDTTSENHYCILAMVDSPDDHVGAYQTFLSTGTNSAEQFEPDELTPSDNNVTHRNYVLFDTTAKETFAGGFYVRNPTKNRIQTTIQLKHPDEWRVRLENVPASFPLEPGEQRGVKLTIRTLRLAASGKLQILQTVPTGRKQPRSKVLGGLTMEFAPRK